MNDIFKDMQAKIGCEYISNLPSYKRKVWHEMKRLNPADYEAIQLEDFSKYVFGMPYQTLKDVMKAGYFLIVACQRPDAKYFSDGIRDNFNFRVGLGRISELGYGMLFGSDVKKQFFQKRIKGRGYCDVGTSVISEFYTPLVPKGHDFLQEIGRLEEKRTASNES